MPDTMRAIVFEKFGGPDVLELRTDVMKPQASAGRALIKQYATSANPLDVRVRSGTFFAFTVSKPKIPGGDVCGVVEQGSGKFKAGDKVFGMTEGGLPWVKNGTYAEYYAAKETDLVSIPAALSFEEAAGVPLVSLTAYQALDSAGVEEGTRVLIHAGAGGVGSVAIQLAKARGAYVITTAGTRNIEFVTKELGADQAIDYTKERFDEVLKSSPVNAVIDCIGGDVEKRSFKVLKRRGHYQRIANANVSMLSVAAGKAWSFLRLAPKCGLTIVQPNGAQLQKVADLISEGKVKLVVDQVLPLEQAAEAHRYLEQGHARGKVVLKIWTG